MIAERPSKKRYANLRGLLLASALAVSLCLVVGLAAAQDPPQGSSLVGSWDGSAGEYADVWGDGDYAYVARFGTPRVHIIDISDPSSPVQVAVFVAPDEIAPRLHGELSGSAQDVKVADGLMFVGLEQAPGIGFVGRTVIADVRDPTNPVALTVVDTMDAVGVHNVFYADGYLYQVDSARALVSVVDLTTYDPDSAPASITTEKWRLNSVGNDFVHDITVENGRLYVSGWSGGLHIYDVSNIAVAPPVFLGSVSGKSTHSAWPSADGNFVVTGEERSGGGIKVYRIVDEGGSVSLDLTDKIRLRTSQATSVHNQVMVGNRLYVSWYEAGLRVYEIDPATGRLDFVASYDTHSGTPGSYYGAWGVYPFLGADRVLVSDIRGGLNVIDVDGQVPCAAVAQLKSVQCKRGRIKAKVIMADRLLDRSKFTFSIDSDLLDVRIKRRNGQLKHDGGYVGAQVLTLTNPAGCFAPIEVDCG